MLSLNVIKFTILQGRGKSVITKCQKVWRINFFLRSEKRLGTVCEQKVPI